MSAAESWVGRRLGRYLIEAPLGRGGMGAVFRARDVDLDRACALKLLPAHMAAAPGFVERFKREARKAAQLTHANVVQVYEVGEAEGTHFIAMQLMERSLADLLEERGRLDVLSAARIVREAARGLGRAHARGMVHRDIKPANILLGEGDEVRIGDFGLVKDQGGADSALTQTGAILGTPQYMAPEQCDGIPDIDGRADLFSLGLVLYACLAGKVPAKGSTPLQIIRYRVTEDPPPLREALPGVPPELDAIVAALLVRDREQRLASADELVTRLDRFLARLAGLNAETMPLGQGHAAIAGAATAGPAAGLTTADLAPGGGASSGLAPSLGSGGLAGRDLVPSAGAGSAPLAAGGAGSGLAPSLGSGGLAASARPAPADAARGTAGAPLAAAPGDAGSPRPATATALPPAAPARGGSRLGLYLLAGCGLLAVSVLMACLFFAALVERPPATPGAPPVSSPPANPLAQAPRNPLAQRPPDGPADGSEPGATGPTSGGAVPSEPPPGWLNEERPAEAQRAVGEEGHARAPEEAPPAPARPEPPPPDPESSADARHDLRRGYAPRVGEVWRVRRFERQSYATGPGTPTPPPVEVELVYRLEVAAVEGEDVTAQLRTIELLRVSGLEVPVRGLRVRVFRDPAGDYDYEPLDHALPDPLEAILEAEVEHLGQPNQTLPERPVRVGEPWSLPADAVTGMLGLSQASVLTSTTRATATLVSVEPNGDRRIALRVTGGLQRYEGLVAEASVLELEAEGLSSPLRPKTRIRTQGGLRVRLRDPAHGAVRLLAVEVRNELEVDAIE